MRPTFADEKRDDGSGVTGGLSWHWMWLVPIAIGVLGPAVFAGVRWVVESGSSPEWLQKADFARVCTRIAMITGVGVAWVVLRSRKLLTFASWGLRPSAGAWWAMGRGGLVGGAAGMVLILAAIGAGAREWHAPEAWGFVVSALFTGAVVGFWEEAAFRGLMQGQFAARMRPVVAIGLQGTLFAMLHFLKPPGFGIEDPIGWDSGWRYLLALPCQLVEPAHAVRFGVIAVLGWTWGLVALRRGDVWWGVGMHAGLVAVIQSYGDWTQHVEGAADVWFSRDPSRGWAALVLALVLWGYAWLRERRAE